MEIWTDTAVILHVRPYGEGAAVINILAREHGRYAGYVYGAQGKQNILQPGNLVTAEWKARLREQLGTFALELEKAYASGVMDSPLKLAALLSACSLAEAALPERESNPGQFEGFKALCDLLQGDQWAEAYILWEIAFLREMGFGLDFSKCAATGTADNLVYVSPRTGRAVSAQAGEPYKEKLLELPGFLTGNLQIGDNNPYGEILKGLDLTGYFLVNKLFGDTAGPFPEARISFRSRIEKLAAQGDMDL